MTNNITLATLTNASNKRAEREKAKEMQRVESFVNSQLQYALRVADTTDSREIMILYRNYKEYNIDIILTCLKTKGFDVINNIDFDINMNLIIKW